MYKGFLPKFKFENRKDWMDITEMVVIPQKDKIFSLWAENHTSILEMIQGILKRK
jgi:hypothetical protein